MTKAIVSRRIFGYNSSRTISVPFIHVNPLPSVNQLQSWFLRFWCHLLGCDMWRW